MGKNYLIIRETPETLKAYAAMERISLVTRAVIVSAGFISGSVLVFFLCRSVPGPPGDPYLLLSAAPRLLSALLLPYGIFILVTVINFLLLNIPGHLRSAVSRLPLCIVMSGGYIIALDGDAVLRFAAGKTAREIRSSCRKEAERLLCIYGSRTDGFARAVARWVRLHRKYPGMVVFGHAVREIEESGEELIMSLF